MKFTKIVHYKIVKCSFGYGKIKHAIFDSTHYDRGIKNEGTHAVGTKEQDRVIGFMVLE